MPTYHGTTCFLDPLRSTNIYSLTHTQLLTVKFTNAPLIKVLDLSMISTKVFSFSLDWVGKSSHRGNSSRCISRHGIIFHAVWFRLSCHLSLFGFTRAFVTSLSAVLASLKFEPARLQSRFYLSTTLILTRMYLFLRVLRLASFRHRFPIWDALFVPPYVIILMSIIL